MKTKFSIGNITVGEVKIENVSIEQEYSATEAMAMLNGGKKFVKDLIKDLPEMLSDLERAYDRFNEIDERQAEICKEKFMKFISQEVAVG